MNCEEIRQHWHVFHDSEGDAEIHLRINDHLSLCDECSKWFFQQSRLEDGMVEKLRDVEATKEVWKTIRQQCVATEPHVKRHYVFWSSLVAIMLVCLVAIFRGGVLPGGRSFDLAELSAGLHEKLATGREQIQLISNSTNEIEEYLRGSVSFPVRCPPPEEIGFSLRGGGTCHFEQDTVAYIVGQVDGTPVSVFVMDRNSLSHFPLHYNILGRESVYQCRARDVGIVMSQVNDNLVLVTGKAPADRLRQVLKAYGSH